MDWRKKLILRRCPELFALFPVPFHSSGEWDSIDRSVRDRLQKRSEDGEFWSVVYLH